MYTNNKLALFLLVSFPYFTLHTSYHDHHDSKSDHNSQIEEENFFNKNLLKTQSDLNNHFHHYKQFGINESNENKNKYYSTATIDDLTNTINEQVDNSSQKAIKLLSYKDDLKNKIEKVHQSLNNTKKVVREKVKEIINNLQNKELDSKKEVIRKTINWLYDASSKEISSRRVLRYCWYFCNI